MIIDSRTELAKRQAINTGAPGTYLLGDVVDSGAAGGPGGEEAILVLQVMETFTSEGSASVSFSLVSDAQAAIATDGSATYHLNTGAIALDRLVAGATIGRFPVPSSARERYLGLLQTTIGAAFTGGEISAFFTFDASNWQAFPSGIG